MTRPQANRTAKGERGQILMLSALMLVVLLGMVAMVVDVGRFLHERQDIQNTVDAAALAGVYELPDDGTAAQNMAIQYALANDSDLTSGDVTITFRCVVGDRDGNGQPDSADIPAVCDPGAALFTCAGDVCASPCDPVTAGDKCNTIVVESDKDVPFIFARALSLLSGNTGSINAAACRGSCGGNPNGPADVVIILDRTRSMSTGDLNNAKDAALAVLELFNPSLQHTALGVLPQSKFTDDCASVSNADMTNPASGDWVPVELSSDYQNADGTLDGSSALVSTINCLERAPFPFGCWPNLFCYQTNLGEPVNEARLHLQNDGRAGVTKAIILLSDGEANLPGPGNPCLYAYNQANSAKVSHDIEVFTIGFGIENAECNLDSSLYHDVPVTELLADMATDSQDDGGNGGCDTDSEREAENTDGDHFFCEARGEELVPVFQAAAEQLAQGSRLILLPE